MRDPQRKSRRTGIYLVAVACLLDGDGGRSVEQLTAADALLDVVSRRTRTADQEARYLALEKRTLVAALRRPGA